MTIEAAAKPSLPSVDVKTSTSTDTLADDVIQGLKLAGACIIKNLYSQETIDNLQGEVKPFLSDAGNLTCKSPRVQ